MLCCCAWQATATTYRFMTPSAVLLAADLVFIGTVSDVVTESRDGQPWTLVTFRVDELFRGFGYDPGLDEPAGGSPDEEQGPQDPAEVAPETVTLAFLGGETAGGALLVSGSPAWRFDEVLLVAAYQTEGLASPLVGFRQGLWRVEDDGMVDLDGWALAVADDGSPVRAQVGATASQLVRSVQGLLAGDLQPAEPSADLEVPGEDGREQGAPAEPEGEPGVEPAEGAEPAQQQTEEPATIRILAADYHVDDSGGPLLLSDEVTLAADAWRAAVAGSVDLQLARSPDSRNRVRYGSEGLLGPDTLSLTTVAAGGVVTAHLAPGAGDLTQTALVHELGVMLGVPEGGDGVMATALSAPLAGPSPADVAELVALTRFEPADLTRDGVVDFYDLLALAAAYGESGVNLAGDLDGDGTVDGSDVEALRQRYRFSEPIRPSPPASAGDR